MCPLHTINVPWAQFAEALRTEPIPGLVALVHLASERITAPPETALIVDGGSGIVLEQLAARCGRVTACEDWEADRQTLMSIAARHNNVAITHATLPRLPSSDRQFDLVWWLIPAWLRADRTGAFAEIWRVLREDGIFTLIAWDYPAEGPPRDPGPNDQSVHEVQLRRAHLSPIDELDVHLHSSASSHAALAEALEWASLSRTPTLRSRLARINLALNEIELAHQAPGSVEISIAAKVVHSCRQNWTQA